jgi:formiminoglutamate deiminase
VTPSISAAASVATSYWCDMVVVDNSGSSVPAVTERVTIEVVDGRVSAITPGSAQPVGSTHLRGLTIAGFANAHSHAFHRALRGRTQAGSGSFWAWRDVMYLAAERLDPDRYFRLARATFAEMALAGVATVGEFHYVHHQPDGKPYRDPNAMGHSLLAAATEAGIRITLLDTLYLHGGMANGGFSPPTGAQVRYSDGCAEAWTERVTRLADSVDERTQRLGAAIHSVRAVDPGSMTIAAEWADAAHVPIHAHVSEQPAENEQCVALHDMTPTELLARAGLVGERFTAVHATHLTDTDVALLGSSGSSVCICPTTERDLGDGIGRTVDLDAAGAALCLGSDSHAVIDLLEEARAVELNERLASLQRGNHSATSLLQMATVNGHASLGWMDAGAIRVGNRADLTTVTLSSVRTAGGTEESALAAAIFAATTSDVTSVVIDGNVIVCDGRHRTIDVAAELQSSITELFVG